ncbi:MAG: SRPBCC domain-containing protein [Planctomycetes bacterium]|nr:SRPBCC domain-containing protein [Planctomycetota bacterium]
MTRALERSLLLAAGPLDVFAALSRPEGLAAWLADRAVEAPGGVRLEWDVPGGVAATDLEVVERAPGKRLVFRWAGWGAERTQVACYLAPEGGGTRLVLVEAGFGEGPWWDLAIEEEGEGWDEALARLVRLLGAGPSRRIDKEAVLPAPAARVYAALTREDELRRWLSREARFEPRPGASYRLADPGWAAAGRGRVRALSPHEAIALSWHWDPELPPTELLLHVEQAPGGARLRLAHSGWGTGCEFNRAFEEIEEAWEDALFLLRRYLAGGPT